MEHLLKYAKITDVWLMLIAIVLITLASTKADIAALSGSLIPYYSNRNLDDEKERSHIQPAIEHEMPHNWSHGISMVLGYTTERVAYTYL